VVFLIGGEFVLFVVGTEVLEKFNHVNILPFTKQIEKLGNVTLYEISTGNMIYIAT
jgi:hypothetical protein